MSTEEDTTRTFEVRDGGSFLLDEVGSTRVFTPEDLTPAQRAMRDTARRFADSEVLPRIQCPILIVPAGPTPDRANSDFARMREKMVEAAARDTKNCRVHWIPNTIHDIGYHKPDELAQAIKEFLQGK